MTKLNEMNMLIRRGFIYCFSIVLEWGLPVFGIYFGYKVGQFFKG
jgi:hypothetical protein